MSSESKSDRKVILIVYEFFFPGFKAGGPIQSLVNLIVRLQHVYEFKVITTAYDLNEKRPYDSVRVDEWNKVIVSVGSPPIDVYYAASVNNLGMIYQAINSSSPDVIYVNGMFGKLKLYIILLASFGMLKSGEIIFAPRGMLQEGALSGKSIKKKLFIRLFRLLSRQKNIKWHATDIQERNDIAKIFGSKSNIVIASNIPKLLNAYEGNRAKIEGNLKLIFLSLVAEKKNLHVALLALKEISRPITFHIYGPIKDLQYWNKCLQLINGQVHEIVYKGVVDPKGVQAKFLEYDALLLPTKGENFGHAIYESLSVGTPVIISPFTPWSDVKKMRAGIIVESENPVNWANAIAHFIDLTEHEYSFYSKGAYELAKKYYSENEFESQYETLFS